MGYQQFDAPKLNFLDASSGYVVAIDWSLFNQKVSEMVERYPKPDGETKDLVISDLPSDKVALFENVLHALAREFNKGNRYKEIKSARDIMVEIIDKMGLEHFGERGLKIWAASYRREQQELRDHHNHTNAESSSGFDHEM